MAPVAPKIDIIFRQGLSGTWINKIYQNLSSHKWVKIKNASGPMEVGVQLHTQYLPISKCFLSEHLSFGPKKLDFHNCLHTQCLEAASTGPVH